MTLNIHLLPQYANHKHITSERHAIEEISKITFQDNKTDLKIEMTETNSLIEEKYCLSLESAQFELEGSLPDTDRKNAMIHHHPKGHSGKHLQFTLYGQNEKIRINIEPLDKSDYEKCIKGFICISGQLLDFEKKKHQLTVDLNEYFFNDSVKELDIFGNYLLERVHKAFSDGNMLNNSNEPINEKTLQQLQSEEYLLPFLKWK